MQLRLPVVPVTIGTVLGLRGWALATGYPYFHPFWPPVLLVALLVGTDPATSPRNAPVRLLYGLSLGLVMAVFATVLEENGGNDFCAKILPVPFVNLLVPWFERAGQRLASLDRILAPRWSRLHVGVWLTTAAFGMVTSKGGVFIPSLHEQYGTPLVTTDARGAITCEANPIFCRAFSFPDEGRRWIAGP